MAWLEYFNLVFLEIPNVQFGTVFANPVTYAFSGASTFATLPDRIPKTTAFMISLHTGMLNFIETIIQGMHIYCIHWRECKFKGIRACNVFVEKTPSIHNLHNWVDKQIMSGGIEMTLLEILGQDIYPLHTTLQDMYLEYKYLMSGFRNEIMRFQCLKKQ